MSGNTQEEVLAAREAYRLANPGSKLYTPDELLPDAPSGAAEVRPYQEEVAGGAITEPGAGANAFGYATGVGSAITAYGGGATAFGYAADGGTIYTNGPGAVTVGYAAGSGSSISGGGFGGVSSGWALAGGIITGWSGSTATGIAYGAGSYLIAGNYGLGGGFAFGSALYGGVVRAESRGSAVFGYATGAGSQVKAAGGGFATGRAANAGYMLANHYGAMVHGYVTGTGSAITASGKGSTAFGYASAGADIVASATGSVQFAPGTNAVANSLAVGGALRLNGTTGTPGVLRNGDIWEASGYVYIRSNGASVKIT